MDACRSAARRPRRHTARPGRAERTAGITPGDTGHDPRTGRRVHNIPPVGTRFKHCRRDLV